MSATSVEYFKQFVFNIKTSSITWVTILKIPNLTAKLTNGHESPTNNIKFHYF
jgi:hypothetical protein